MQTANLITYLLTCIIAAATPGPGTISVITYSVYLGWRKTLPVILGIQLGMLAIAVLALSGLTAALSASPALFQLLQYVGALYIAYLGYLSLRHAHAEMMVQSADHGKQGIQSFRHGALVTFASPKTLLFFTSFFPLYINPTHAVLPQMGLLLAIVLGCTLVIHLCYALSVGFVSQWLKQHSFAFNILVGLIFIGLAGYMVWQI
jgi:threonine/homoserine/homoserine lactone efflux protein